MREYCDRNNHQLLPIIAEKVHQKKVQQEKLKAVKAHLNFEEVAQHSELGTPSRRSDLKKRLGSRRVRSMLGDKGKSMSTYSNDSRRQSYHSSRRDTKSCYQSSRSGETEFASEKRHNKRASSRRMKALSKSKGSAGRHWKSKLKRQKSSIEDDLSQPWVCEETDPFTPRIRYFDFPKTRMPRHIKICDRRTGGGMAITSGETPVYDKDKSTKLEGEWNRSVEDNVNSFSNFPCLMRTSDKGIKAKPNN
nr:reverse transcriptase domain-containing protein [Tanacetum cinerariifolium]